MTLSIADEHDRNQANTCFGGEVLESVENDKRYKPQFNQQVDPQNREAISNYQTISVARTESESESLGQVIDRFI